MADETFAYSGATTLTFATSGHSVNDSDGIEFNQISDITIGGIRMTKNLGDHFNRWEYTFVVPVSSESETDWADVLTFFGTSHVNGSVNYFTWTDYDSTATSVYAIQMNIWGQNILGAQYKRCTVTLEELT